MLVEMLLMTCSFAPISTSPENCAFWQDLFSQMSSLLWIFFDQCTSPHAIVCISSILIDDSSCDLIPNCYLGFFLWLAWPCSSVYPPPQPNDASLLFLKKGDTVGPLLRVEDLCNTIVLSKFCFWHFTSLIGHIHTN